MPVIIAIAILPFLIKYPNNIWVHFVVSIATAIPISTLLVKLVPDHILIDINLGFYQFSRLETATILVSMLLAKLPYFEFNWLRGVAKNALFSASILIMITQLSLKYIPLGFGIMIYIVIPFLLPLIYHTIVGTIKPFRILAIVILSYTALIGLDYYFVIEEKGNTEFHMGTYPGFLIIDYLIPVTFFVTLLLGYNPLKTSFSWKNKDHVEVETGEASLSAPPDKMEMEPSPLLTSESSADASSGSAEAHGGEVVGRIGENDMHRNAIDINSKEEATKKEGLPSPQR